MTFHQRSYDIMQCSPDNRNLAHVEDTEARLGFSFPASIREWYARRDAFGFISGQDFLMELDSLKIVSNQGKPCLQFMVENQGVCVWAAELNGEPDPPVLVNVEETEWIPYCTSFSDTIFCQLWDWAHYPLTAWSDADALTPTNLERLKSSFTLLPTTHGWPIECQSLRFEREDASLLLWSTPSICQFNLHAFSEGGFEFLLDVVDNMSDVLNRMDGHDPLSEELIAKRKRSKPGFES